MVFTANRKAASMLHHPMYEFAFLCLKYSQNKTWELFERLGRFESPSVLIVLLGNEGQNAGCVFI